MKRSLPLMHLLAIVAITVGGIPASAQRSDTIVKVVGAPRYPGVETLVPELTIGVADGAPEYMFSSVSDIFVARDRTVLVLDFSGPLSSSVRQYDANGRYLRTIGRAGQGPGEYRAPTGIAQLPDGRILIRDISGRRINVYSESGEPMTTWSLPAYSYATRGRDGLRVDPQGIVAMPFIVNGTNPMDMDQTRSPVLRLRPDGTIVDTVPQPELPAVGLSRIVMTASDGGISMVVPYSPRPHWAWSPLGYFVTGLGDRYAIDLRIPPSAARRDALSTVVAGEQRPPPQWRVGDPVISIRRNSSKVPVSAEERRDRQSQLETSLRQPGTTLSGPIGQIPAIKPFFRGLTVAADGRIWVLASVPSERVQPAARPSSPESPPTAVWTEPTLYEVFDPDGTYLGQVAIPFGTTLRAMSGDIAWGVVRDADDVQVVKRFRIVWR